MTTFKEIKDLPVEERAAIFYGLMDDPELATFLKLEKNEEWLLEKLQQREEEIASGKAVFTTRKQLNDRLTQKYGI